jgi:hypothetical protein
LLRHYGKVGLVRNNPSNNKQSINIKLDSGENDKFDFPHPEVEKIEDASQIYTKPLQIGDCVECHFQNYKWYHGRVAEISKDGSMCEVFYHDQDVSLVLLEMHSNDCSSLTNVTSVLRMFLV